MNAPLRKPALATESAIDSAIDSVMIPAVAVVFALAASIALGSSAAGATMPGQLRTGAAPGAPSTNIQLARDRHHDRGHHDKGHHKGWYKGKGHHKDPGRTLEMRGPVIVVPAPPRPPLPPLPRLPSPPLDPRDLPRPPLPPLPRP